MMLEQPLKKQQLSYSLVDFFFFRLLELTIVAVFDESLTESGNFSFKDGLKV